MTPGAEVMRLAERRRADGRGAAVAASGTLEALREERSKGVRIVSKSPAYLCGMCSVGEPGAPALASLSLCEIL
eukprot:5637363-Pyramimonas_sp.AAC.1